MQRFLIAERRNWEHVEGPLPGVSAHCGPFASFYYRYGQPLSKSIKEDQSSHFQGICSLTRTAPKHSPKHLQPPSRPPKERQGSINLVFTFLLITTYFIRLIWASECPRRPPYRWIVYTRSFYLCFAGSLVPQLTNSRLWTSAEIQSPQCET